MSDVSLELVQEYLELHSFMVLTRRKHRLTKRDESGAESIVLLAANLNPVEPESPLSVVLGPDDLHAVHRAVIDVKGWHTDVFYSSMCETRENLFGFVGPAATAYAEDVFGSSDFARILVVSELPVSADARARAETAARSRGVDHILEFPTILRGILARIQTNLNYTESDVLQLLRIMKRYGLVKDTQLEFDFE